MQDKQINLHTIGELCRMCGVTRRMVLNYEDHKLISPVKIEDKTGYRYYDATSAARICHIKALQKLGFSLDNIQKFITGDYTVLQNHLINLELMQKELENQIFRTKAFLTQKGDFTVHIETLPAADYIIKTKDCQSYADRFMLLQDLTDYVFQMGWQVSTNGRTLISILHSASENGCFGRTSAAWALTLPNEHTVHFPPTQALTVNVKGPYTQLGNAITTLYTYAKEHGFNITGDIREAYLASPQSHKNPEDYVTQIFLPIS